MTPPILGLAAAVVGVLAIICAGSFFLRSRKKKPAGPATRFIVPLLPDHVRVSGLTLMEAEDLLDWLEQNKYEDRGLHCEVEQKTFAVEFRIDAEHQFMKISGMPTRGLVKLAEQKKLHLGS
jgi:hypothetical protein